MSGMTGPARLPLRRFLAEGVVIIASILMAFAIDAGWDARQERERETGYLVQLEQDLVATRDDAERALELEQGYGRMLASLRAALYEDDFAPTDSLAYWFEYTLRSSNFEPVSATLEALIQSGDLTLIEDAELRRELVLYVDDVQDADGIFERYDEADLDALASLNRRVDRMAIRRVADGDTSSAAIDWAALAADPVVRGDLSTHGIAIRGRYNSLSDLLQTLDPLLDRIARVLDDRGVER